CEKQSFSSGEEEAEKCESIMQIINLKAANKVLTVERILKTSETENMEIIKNKEKTINN
ncbi:6324_t:CDS:1, partial [Gigaspora rosea]